MNINIYRDFQICISVLLSKLEQVIMDFLISLLQKLIGCSWYVFCEQGLACLEYLAQYFEIFFPDSSLTNSARNVWFDNFW